MTDMEDNESGFISESGDNAGISYGMTDVEIISVSGINIIARGTRFGRFWLLKGIIPELRESPSSRRRLQKEFELHSRLLHPNIVRVASMEDIPSLGICIVEEWVEGETLAALLRKDGLSRSDRKRILREIISAVGYLHSEGVIHRDLKPQNIMVRKEGGKVVLIDFGLADSGDYAVLKQGAGSKGYMSPEQYSEGGATITDDIYSLGVIMRELCPEYSRIANRCTGTLDRRPPDTSSLLRMIDSADRRPRLVAWGVVAVAAAAIVTAASMYVRSISTETDEIKVQIDTLNNSHTRNIARLDELDNILFIASGRLMTTEAALTAASEDRGLRRRAMVEAYRKIENEYTTFDRERIHLFESDDRLTFNDSINALKARCDGIIRESYDLERFPELAAIDSLVLRGELRGLSEQLLCVYLSIWNLQFEKMDMKKYRIR